ncbi:hypothetical protein CERZMDRAFT_90180 [Cercospora zeae-maydis SCOH1-5]|uniref:Uncharacterized protein n=1 Tax=Cercospora zeae-maydis SCOH1-5 TaxID=717836 RepID=A0A6A6FN89_9PEZI|nr:hypothetical protein CERZMDRAFT_90180 [Cercospora zeae-maydis SCOH1-5]
MFYGRNKFVFTPKVAPVDGVGRIAQSDVQWLQAIGIKQASLVRMIEVKWLGWCRKASLAAYKDGLRETGLGVDRIQVQISCWNDDRWSSGFPSTSLQSITPSRAEHSGEDDSLRALRPKPEMVAARLRIIKDTGQES